MRQNANENYDFFKQGENIARVNINQFDSVKKQIKDKFGDQAAMEFDTGFRLEIAKLREMESYDYGPMGVDPITYGINDYNPYNDEAEKNLRF